MKHIILNLILCCSLVFPAMAQENGEGIRFFEGTWEEALQKAKEENKLIFMDCYSTWCGPCAQMVSKIFPMKEVGDFFNKNFICLKRNMEKEEGNGIALQKRYDVVGYPTYLFITGEGYLTWQDAGFMEADKFIALGRKAISMIGKGDEERFAKGERDEAFVKGYVQESLRMHQADKVEGILNQLYKEKGIKLLKDPDYWQAFDCCAADTESPLSLAFIKNYKKMCKTVGKFATDQKVRNLYVSIAKVISLNDITARYKDSENPAKKEAYFKTMEERKIPYCKELQQEVNFIQFLRKGKSAEAYALGEEALAKADARMLGNWAALGERMGKGKEFRTKMAAWAKRALDLGVDESMQAEVQSVLLDLETSENPVRGGKKSAPRKSLPMRGYLSE
ncbi:MAG: thioredoxin family protein [Bacteroidales bacterium]|nr:thioredoxin family protein [Bacteroidales bacterium]